MKILYVNTFYAPYNVGGAEYSLQIIVEAMQKKKHEVIVLSTSDKEGLHCEIINGVKVYRAGIKNKYWPYGNQKHSIFDKIMWHIKDIYNKNMQSYLEQVILIEKPDIISCHNITGWSVSIWDTLFKIRIPTVQVLHDFYLLCINTGMFKNGKQCKKRCIKCNIIKYLHLQKSKNVNAVVGISQYILEKVLDAGYFVNSLKTVVYNARIIPDNPKENKGLCIVFGFIGSLSERKGIRWLIEQFRKTNLNFITLKIAGTGNVSYEEFLKNMAKDDNRISFLGYTKSEQFYSQIDILVVPSMWEEPLGTVAIEACAHHIPVITSAMGGLKEIIIDGYNGLYCDVSFPDSLSDIINEISTNRFLLMKLKKKARESVCHFLDLDRLTAEYEQVYQQLL